MTEAPREDNRQQPKPKKEQLLSPATAAKKLGLYLPATPEEFQATPITRTQLQAMNDSPPQWLTTLRKEGPHPRDEVSRRLGVSNSALARAGVSDHMTTRFGRCSMTGPSGSWPSARSTRPARALFRAPRSASGRRGSSPSPRMMTTTLTSTSDEDRDAAPHSRRDVTDG